jgi:hypothetical protein
VNLIFTNPWGFLALLGIPLLILIHYLRRRAKVVTVSTLFLLKRTQRESKAGRRFETFSNSLPFWLQIFAVLLLTWILVKPRYGNSRVTQQIAIVLDSSASMQSLREGFVEKLRPHLESMSGGADHASYIVLDHNPRRGRIYQGDDAEELLERLRDWNPTDGALDPTATLRIARSLVGPEGLVVYLTDHDGPQLPLSALRLSLGESRSNCGFTGVSFEETDEGPLWSTIVRNYSNEVLTRQWSVETPDGKRSDEQALILEPRRFKTITGRFPKGEERCVIRLSGDDLPFDDVLPIVAPKPRTALLLIDGVEELGERMVKGFAHVERAEGLDEADFILAIGSEGSTSLPTILFAPDGDQEVTGGRLLAEEHPLTTGLNFQALSLSSRSEIKSRPDDQPLLYLDDRPVILLRRDAISKVERLVFAFPAIGHNALKLPAVAVLLHRFCEGVARDTVSYHTAALETSQLLSEEFPPSLTRADLALSFINLDGEVAEIPLKEGFRTTQRAMAEPGFLSLSTQGSVVLRASVHFADTREADLSKAASVSLPDLKAGVVGQRTREDHWWRWVAVLLLFLVIAAWYFSISRSPEK